MTGKEDVAKGTNPTWPTTGLGDTEVFPVIDILMGNSMKEFVRRIYGDQHLQSKPLTSFLPRQKKLFKKHRSSNDFRPTYQKVKGKSINFAA